MKCRIGFFFFILFVISYSYESFANQFLKEETVHNIGHSIKLNETFDGKIYLAPGAIYVTETGICIHCQGNIIAVKQIGTDENGVYVLSKECRFDQDWECPKCHHVNNGNRHYCTNCNYCRP
jgi:hypothetical protein